MSKKHTFKKTAALLLGIALTVGSTGCNFFPTDSQKDLNQVVATINISDILKDENADVAKDIDTLIKDGKLATNIYKKDLVSYYLSVGYQYVEQYGYTHEATFNMLMDSLVNRNIMRQYAAAYYMETCNLSADACEQFIQAEVDAAEGKVKELLKAHPQVSAMKYFLTKNSSEMEEYDAAIYGLKKSLNSSLDSWETSIIEAEEEEHNHGEARTTPTGVNTEKEDYYTKDYAIYTGRNDLSECGAYEKVEGSTKATRKKAYNSFLANLQSYGMIQENEDTTDIELMDYYYVELESALGQALISKYYEDLQKEAWKALTPDYVTSRYTATKEAQEKAYAADPTAFETALGSLSDTSFTLTGEAKFGFVYNILLPFSASQEQAYSAAKNKGLSQDQLFNARKEILTNVQAKDLRESWFSVHDHANHAYTPAEGATYYNNGKLGDTTYLFFENSVAKTEQYESVKQYAGQYPYNGIVEKGDHEFTFTPNKMDIDAFLAEMEAYITHVSGATASGSKVDAYEETTYVENGVVDYSKFVYYEGSVAGLVNDSANYFNAEKTEYKALSAVNELMFAYSTDTGCLNTYMGYAVSPYKTNFVGEFEYAAQYAIEKGVGTYVVAPSDYGWHIIYVSYVYEGGDVYANGYVDGEKEVEGTFSNLFYESLKNTAATSYTSEKEGDVLNKYNNDSCVTRFEKNYKDLLELS